MATNLRNFSIKIKTKPKYYEHPANVCELNIFCIFALEKYCIKAQNALPDFFGGGYFGF